MLILRRFYSSIFLFTLLWVHVFYSWERTMEAKMEKDPNKMYLMVLICYIVTSLIQNKPNRNKLKFRGKSGTIVIFPEWGHGIVCLFHEAKTKVNLGRFLQDNVTSCTIPARSCKINFFLKDYVFRKIKTLSWKTNLYSRVGFFLRRDNLVHQILMKGQFNFFWGCLIRRFIIQK